MTAPPLTALATAVLHLPGAPERVLEVCCGAGDGVFFLAREFPSARVRGVDASARATREAARRIGLDPEGRVAFKRGRPRSLPYPEALFDLVVQRRGRLHPRETIRVLRPGGHLIQVEPVGGSLTGVRQSWTRHRLARLGLEVVSRGEADGARFCVGRLGGDPGASPE